MDYAEYYGYDGYEEGSHGSGYSWYGGSNETELYCPVTTNIVIPVIYFIIATVGLAANALVIYIIVILQEYQKTVTNIYVVQLAATDFLFLFVLPFEAVYLMEGRWNYGNAWCKITQSVRMLNYYASTLFLTVMSVDRYLAINHAMNPRATRFRTKRAVRIISLVIWTLGFLCVVYILINAQVSNCKCDILFHTNEENEEPAMNENNVFSIFKSNASISEEEITDFLQNNVPSCSWKKNKELSLWIICNFVLAFVFPLIIICLCYSQIILKISKPLAVGNKSQQSNKTRKRVTYMVTALVSVFIICWLPYHSFNLSRVNDSQLSENICSAVQQFTLVLAYLSSALNPFLYTFLGTNFKKRMNNALGRTRSFRPSFGSRSEYNQGQQAKKMKRKSSKMSLTGFQKSPDDDTFTSQSNVTKHTVVTHNLILQGNDEDTV